MEFAAKILLNSNTYRKEGKEILFVRFNRIDLSLETTNNYEKAPSFTIKEADKLLKNPLFRTALYAANVEQGRNEENWLKPVLFTKGKYSGNSTYIPYGYRLPEHISFSQKQEDYL